MVRTAAREQIAELQGRMKSIGPQYEAAKRLIAEMESAIERMLELYGGIY